MFSIASFFDKFFLVFYKKIKNYLLLQYDISVNIKGLSDVWNLIELIFNCDQIEISE